MLAAMSLYTMVWMLAEYGFPVVGARDAAACRDRASLADLFGRHVMGRLWMALPGLAVGVGGTLLSPLLHENPVLGALATANGLLAAFNLGWFFQGTLRFRTSVMLEAAGFAINLPLILLLVHGPGDSPVALAILFGSNLVCTLAAYAIALHGIDRRAIRWHGGRQLVARGQRAVRTQGLHDDDGQFVDLPAEPVLQRGAGRLVRRRRAARGGRTQPDATRQPRAGGHGGAPDQRQGERGRRVAPDARRRRSP